MNFFQMEFFNIKFSSIKLIIMHEKDLKNINIAECDFSVLDFETTGTSSKTGRVIEIGLVKVSGLQITEQYSSLINPGMQIPWFITNLTGITNDDVFNAPTFEEIADDLIQFIDNSIITAHNIPFDYSFLKKEFSYANMPLPDIPTLCTLQLSRKLLSHLPSKSLGKVANHLRIQHKNVHRALGDATVTAKILIRFLKILKEDHGVETVEDLLGFTGISKQKTMTLIKKSLANDLAKVPKLPGIYMFKNRQGEILYIGKAKSLKDRVKNYFYTNAAAKAKKIVRRASNLEFHSTGSELSALIAETELIKLHNPPMNVQLKAYPRTYYISLPVNKEFPKLKSTSIFELEEDQYFGPYNNRDTVKTLMEIIDKTFLLRECTEKEFSKNKKCYLADIKRCLAPCINKSIVDEYENEMEKVRMFLSGNNDEALKRLLEKMKKLSDGKKFEEAAEIRDTVNLLLEQINKSAIINGPINTAKVLIKILSSHEEELILLINGKIFIKDFFMDEKQLFNIALEDYYSGAIKLFEDVTEKDVERLKIALTWLVKNKVNIKVYYLEKYSSKDELFAAMKNN